MNDDSTETERAIRAWDAVFPGAKRPDDETLETMVWAARWYRIAETKRPLRENDQLGRIEETANKLARLLAENLKTMERIEADWPLPFLEIDPDGTRREIEALAKAARTARVIETPDETVVRKGGGAVLHEKFGSPHGIFIERLATAYEKATGIEAGCTYNFDENKLEGSFIDFVQELARQFGIDQPTPYTIRKAYRKRKKRRRNKQIAGTPC